MIAKVQVISERAKNWTNKKQKEVHERILSLLDLTVEGALLNTFDYSVSPEEVETIKEPVVGKTFSLVITDFETNQYTRRNIAKGRIVMNGNGQTAHDDKMQ